MARAGAALALSLLLVVGLAGGLAVLAGGAAVRRPLGTLVRIASPAAPARTTTTSEGVVKELRALDRLETAAFTAETIVESDNAGNLLQNVLYRDRMLLVARGRVIAGVELSRLSREEVAVDGQSLAVTLPAPQLFSVTLDDDVTHVADRSLGLLSKGDPGLESRLRRDAEAAIRRSACQSRVLDEAAAQARAAVSRLMALAGFSSVTVRVPPGTCA